MESNITSDKYIPPVITYGKLKPQSVKAKSVDARFNPVTGGPFTPFGNNNIRFNVKGEAFLDPYSTFLIVDVKNNNTNSIAFDNSAHSLFEILSINIKGNQIEYIDNYDVMCSIINDVYFSNEQRQSKTYEGFGCGIVEPLTPFSTFWDIMPNVSYATKSPNFECFKIPKNLVLNEANLRTSIYPTFVSGTIIAGLGTNIPSFDNDAEVDRINNISLINLGNTLKNTADEQTFYKLRSWDDTKLEKMTVGSFEQILKPGEVKTFVLPLYSTFMGFLVQSDNYKYLPLQFLDEIELNLQLNPYCFYSIYMEGDDTTKFIGKTNPWAEMSRKNYSIENIYLRTKFIFFENVIHLTLKQSLSQRGLYLHCLRFSRGATHNFFSSHDYDISRQYKSLKSIFFFIFSDLYKWDIFPHIRKLNRFDGGIKSFQFRFGTQYFPPWPVTIDNSNQVLFILELIKCFKRTFDPRLDVGINTFNFGDQYENFSFGTDLISFIKDNAGDNTGFYGAKVPKDKLIDLTALTSITSATMDYCTEYLYELSKYIRYYSGKAIYAYEFDTVPNDDTLVSGINTIIEYPMSLRVEVSENMSLEYYNRSEFQATPEENATFRNSLRIESWYLHDFVVLIDPNLNVVMLK